MTNDGIIEGHTENSGCSDLSPVTYFGSGETRHENAEEFNGWGAVGFCATPLPIFFMKYLALLAVGASVSYGQQFSGTGYNLNNGEFLIIQGTTDSTVDSNQVHRERMARYRQMNAELSASINAMRAEAEMANQTRELREQTELLRKIANE